MKCTSQVVCLKKAFRPVRFVHIQTENRPFHSTCTYTRIVVCNQSGISRSGITCTCGKYSDYVYCLALMWANCRRRQVTTQQVLIFFEPRLWREHFRPHIPTKNKQLWCHGQGKQPAVPALTFRTVYSTMSDNPSEGFPPLLVSSPSSQESEQSLLDKKSTHLAADTPRGAVFRASGYLKEDKEGDASLLPDEQRYLVVIRDLRCIEEFTDVLSRNEKYCEIEVPSTKEMETPSSFMLACDEQNKEVFDASIELEKPREAELKDQLDSDRALQLWKELEERWGDIGTSPTSDWDVAVRLQEEEACQDSMFVQEQQMLELKDASLAEEMQACELARSDNHGSADSSLAKDREMALILEDEAVKEASVALEERREGEMESIRVVEELSLENVLDMSVGPLTDSDKPSSSLRLLPLESAVRLCQRVNELAADYEGVKPIAVDEMIFTAERFFEKLSDFDSQGKPTRIDVGFHYTQEVNLRNIRTLGLLSKPEREESNIESRFHGSKYGDGIYSAKSSLAFDKRYGEVGIVVVRLEGSVAFHPNTRRLCADDPFDTLVVDQGTDREFSITKSAGQVLPLFEFYSGTCDTLLSYIRDDVLWYVEEVVSSHLFGDKTTVKEPRIRDVQVVL